MLVCYLGRGVSLICVFDAWCGELWFGRWYYYALSLCLRFCWFELVCECGLLNYLVCCCFVFY